MPLNYTASEVDAYVQYIADPWLTVTPAPREPPMQHWLNAASMCYLQVTPFEAIRHNVFHQL